MATLQVGKVMLVQDAWWQLANQEALRLGLPPSAAMRPAPGRGIRRPADESPFPAAGAELLIACPVVGADAPVAPPPVAEVGARVTLNAPGGRIVEGAVRVLPSEVQVLGALHVAPDGVVWVAPKDGPLNSPGRGLIVLIRTGHAVIHSVLGRCGLAVLPSGSLTALGLVAAPAVIGFEGRFRGEDARVLLIQRRGCDRHRDSGDVMLACTEERFIDWPLSVRTSAWCGNYRTRDGGPRMHFESWKARRRLNDDECGVDRYDVLSDVLEAFGCYDQADVTNLLAAEKIVRQLQVIERFYDDKKALGQGSGAKVPRYERQAFLGGGPPASIACPALVEHVSKELERVGNIKKSVRKLREEESERQGRGKVKKKFNLAD